MNLDKNASHQQSTQRAEQTALHCKQTFQQHIDDLITLAKIPSISFDGYPESEVKRSADAVAQLLKKTGLENVEILTLSGAHPYVYGEWIKKPGAPTAVLYAHHDVQPVGRESVWQSKPFEPVIKPGPGGQRLYGRGTADDKAGIVVHTAAIASYLQTCKELPINVKVLIEGEEEIGSTHLEQFLKKYQDKLKADVIILTDTSNYDCGKPALTVALRGMVGVEVEVRALQKTVHSGMWGGPVPDPVMALSKMLSNLVSEDGQIKINGVLEQVKPISPSEQQRLNQIPYDEKVFREQVGMVSGAKILKDSRINPISQIWRLPSLTVNAIQASSRTQAGNIINDVAWAKVTIRLVDGMDPERTKNLLIDELKKQCPWGLEVHIKSLDQAGAWSTEPVGPAFDAAKVSMQKGYGVEPYFMGCGGTIPFVKPFADVLGGVPALLIGVEDPYTNAHGENESLLLSDFENACVSQIYLFEELGKNLCK